MIMPFLPRNPYYLRLSERIVVPLYLYLDERHLEWMSDLVLQHVLADLRPHIVQKLKAETGLMPGTSKKTTTVETHRGETYQFCYFFRKTEPHSVVVKTRNFVAVKPQKKTDMPLLVPQKARGGKRKASRIAEKRTNEDSRKKRKTKGKGKARDDDLSSPSAEESDDDYEPASPVKAPRQTGAFEDIMDIDDDVVPPTNNNFSVLEIEDEEEKPKPVLQLKYQGFDIYGYCLCIVVEPWPLIRAASKPVTLQPQLTLQAPGAAPSQRASSSAPASAARAKTPLFFPDEDRESTPAFSLDGKARLERVSNSRPAMSTLLDESLYDSEDSEDGGMITFSQVLSNTGENRAGAANDDEDMDVAAAMFFGDADERREL